MATIKAAVIGTGFIGPAHLEALRRIGGVDVIAIASIEYEKACSLADRFSIPRVYRNWEEVIGDSDVEVVHNCTPNNLHYVINRAAILAGKHIVSEKPLTLDSGESGDLIRLLKTKPVVNAINFNYRFYPMVQQARSMALRGALGSVYLVHGHYLQDWLYYNTDYNWRIEAGLGGASRAVADIGSHWFDLVQFITGLKVKQVLADLVTVYPRRKRPGSAIETFRGKEIKPSRRLEEYNVRTEDAGSVLFRLRNGARGALTVSQVSAGRKNREWFEIDGSKAAVAWDQEEPNQLWIGHREKANEVMSKDPSLTDAAVRRYVHYPGGHPEGYPDGPKNLFMNVYDFIRSGRDPRKARPDFPTFADGHWENRLAEAVLRSNKTRQWVNVK